MTRPDSKTATSLPRNIAGGSIVVYAVALSVMGVIVSKDARNEDAVRAALVTCSILAGAVYLAGLWCSGRRAPSARPRLLGILLVGLVARCIVLVSPTFLENDYHRYLLDGAVTASGESPYRLAPNELIGDDSTEGLRSDAFNAVAMSGRETIEQVNHPHLATIYPPVAQAVFALAHLIAPFNITAFRIVLLAFDLATVLMLLLLLRELKLPAVLVAWYWWNPVLLREVTSSAHMDVIAFPFVMAAVFLAIRKRTAWCSLALVVAVGTKLWPVLLAPVLLRMCSRRLSAMLGGLAIVLAGTSLMLWPMLVGVQGGDAGLEVFSRYWRNNDGFFAIWSYVTGAVLPYFSITGDDAIRYSRFGVGMLVCAWAVFCALKAIRDGHELAVRTLRVVAALFLLAPTQFPWYYLWMLPLLAVRSNFALLLYTVTLPLYYLHYDDRSVLWIEHGPVWVALIVALLFGRRRSGERAKGQAI